MKSCFVWTLPTVSFCLIAIPTMGFQVLREPNPNYPAIEIVAASNKKPFLFAVIIGMMQAKKYIIGHTTACALPAVMVKYYRTYLPGTLTTRSAMFVAVLPIAGVIYSPTSSTTTLTFNCFASSASQAKSIRELSLPACSLVATASRAGLKSSCFSGSAGNTESSRDTVSTPFVPIIILFRREGFHAE